MTSEKINWILLKSFVFLFSALAEVRKQIQYNSFKRNKSSIPYYSTKNSIILTLKARFLYICDIKQSSSTNVVVKIWFL